MSRGPRWASGRTARLLSGLLLLAAGIALALPAPLLAAGDEESTVSADVRLLPLRRPVSALTGAAPSEDIRLLVVEDSLLAARAAPGFADVRFVDARGRSHPFLAMPPRLEDARWEETPLVRLGRDAAAGFRGWSVEASPQPRASIVVLVPPGVDRRGLRIESTTNGHTWQMEPDEVSMDRVRRRLAPGSRPSVGGWESIRILRSENRLRFRILDVEGVLAEDQEPRTFEERMVPAPRGEAAFHVEGSGFTERTWRTTLVLDGPPRALAGMTWSPVGEAPFLPGRIEVRVPEGTWQRVNQTTFTPGNGPESLSWIPLRGDAVRLEVSAADPPHAPIRVERLEFVPQRFAFRPPGDGGMWIAYGDAFVAPADWPLDPRMPATATFVPVSMGPEEANPWYSPPGFGLEWLKRHPAVLTLVMVLVLVGVAAVAWTTRTRGDLDRGEG